MGKQATFKKFWNSLFEEIVGIKQTRFVLVYSTPRERMRHFFSPKGIPYWRARTAQRFVVFADEWCETALKKVEY